MVSQNHPIPAHTLALLFAGAAILTFAGCYGTTAGGYVATNRGYAAPGYAGYAPGYADDYVYYPNYEVYYNNTRHQYVYRDRDRWVTRATPPQYWAPNSASVPMNFHDSPERHHADVIRTYPRNWHPATRNDRDHHDRDRDHDDDHR